MKKDNFVATEAIIRNLLDPRSPNKYISALGKKLYLRHYLACNWKEICGPVLAEQCCIDKIEGDELYIRTQNSILANELYIMQDYFLKKINSFLLGSLFIRKLHFHSGGSVDVPEKPASAFSEEESHEEENISFTYCPRCGCRMRQENEICSVCEREEREEMRRNLAQLLRIQPWLGYEEARLYYQCDKLLFLSVKDSLKNFYFEKVRLELADKQEELMAVLFLTGKPPEEITSAIRENALAYLRRDQSVLACGSRLYDKK